MNYYWLFIAFLDTNIFLQLQTKPATITHFLKLHMCMERDDQVIEFNLKIPVQLAEILPLSSFEDENEADAVNTQIERGEEDEVGNNITLSQRRPHILNSE